jgi:hypothetical protein
MKNNLFNGILAIGLIVLYALHFSSTETSSDNEEFNISVDSTKVDSSASMLSLSDTTSLDSLKEADYSRVGVLDILVVVDQCPILSKKFNQTRKQLKALQNKKYSIEKELYDYQAMKQKELETKEANGTLIPAIVQYEEKILYQKAGEADQAIKALQPKLERIQKAEQKNGIERDIIIKEAVDEINGELKLDYILVNNGTMTNVIPVSDKNNITKYIIQKINNNHK